MLLAKFHDHRTIGSVGKDFEGFYHIWAMQGFQINDFLTVFPIQMYR